MWTNICSLLCQAPYHVEHTSSCQITEVKQHWANIVFRCCSICTQVTQSLRNIQLRNYTQLISFKLFINLDLVFNCCTKLSSLCRPHVHICPFLCERGNYISNRWETAWEVLMLLAFFSTKNFWWFWMFCFKLTTCVLFIPQSNQNGTYNNI